MPGAVGPTHFFDIPFVRVLWRTVVKYSEIDGQQRAASFAYYAFFAMFPLLLVLVAIGSYFFDPSKVGNIVLDEVGKYVFVDTDKHDMVHETIRGVIKARRGVGLFAVLGLVWSSLRFFQSLLIGVNRAWGTHEYSWWRLPLQNLLMVGVLVSALTVGFVAPALLRQFAMLHALSVLIPSIVLFYGFTMFYKLAPRRRTTLREVWVAALAVTILIQILQSLFILYARNMGHYNAVYGAFGSVIVLLMWIYLSGSVIIMGGCYCAARLEVAKEIERGREIKLPPEMQ